jgi:hypothetical protein
MRGILAGLLLVLAGCQATPPAETVACALPAPTVIEQTGDPHGADGRLLQVWEIADAPVLWSEASPAGGYADFREQVRTKGIETDAVALLKAAPTTDAKLAANNMLVVTHAGEWVRPAGCFEKLMVGLQHERIDTFKAPTEFVSVVMRSPDKARLKIYFFTVNQDGIGRMSPVTNPAALDREAGWTMELVLHPHAFHPGQPALNGIVAPSVPDAGFNFNASEDGLQQSWITNGIDTVRIPAAAFALFER